MTKRDIFLCAHECAKQDRKFFPDLSYGQAFRNALRGAHMAALGYTGSLGEGQ
jgi:hypothetical protein